jgi:hypothetical protein
MKSCSYCGRQSDDAAIYCVECGTKIETSQPKKPPCNKTDPEWHPSIVDLSQLKGAFFHQEGYSRPDWEIIGQAIEGTPSKHLALAWTEAAMQWVLKLRTDLGGQYRVSSAQEFILLSSLDSDASRSFLAFAEKTLEQIYIWLKDAAWQEGNGKHVILLFAEEDDYYQYVSYFYPEGVYPITSGCLIQRLCPHCHTVW